DPAHLSSKIQRGRWYRRENPSQVERPWLISYPLQVQLRTGKGRLTENFDQSPAGPRWLGRSFRSWQRHKCAMDHFFDAAELTGSEFLMDELFVFGSDVDGHRKYPYGFRL